MNLPFEFALRAPSDEQRDHANFWWSLTDKLFRLMQWIFFLSLLIYLDTKAKSIILTTIIAILIICLYKATTSTYEQYIHFNVRWGTTNRCIAFSLHTLSILVFGVASWFVGFGLTSSLIDTFVKFQVGK